jgi:protein-S-isoprenylcysteine O-methyltransferase Ste14
MASFFLSLLPFFLQLRQLALTSAAARGAVAIFLWLHRFIVATRENGGNYAQHYERYDDYQQETQFLK